MRKILGVEGDTDYDKLSLDVICEAKEWLYEYEKFVIWGQKL